MEIPIGYRPKEKDLFLSSPKLDCSIDIPLSFLKKLKNPAIKKLAEIGIMTIEDLHFTTKEHICTHIQNRRVRKSIFAAKHEISQKAFISDEESIKQLDKKIRDKNIRLTANQRECVIAVYVFAKIIADIESTMTFLFDLNSKELPFRQKALLNKVFDISVQIISKKAA